MFPTYVRHLPDGTESGSYLALDLGGTNFRVLVITLQGNDVHMENKIYPIAQTLMQGLDVGRLVTWTKGFSCAGVEGEDVVRLLHEAIARRPNLNVRCVAILNDTVGCLMSCAFTDHNTYVGVIIGTGTNACYMEKLSKVELWDGQPDADPNQVVINTEWGAFGDDGCLDFIRTPYDKDIDLRSINPGKQLFEKMISGMYLGEVVRLAIVSCVEQGALFQGKDITKLREPNKFFTKYVSEIESENEHFASTRKVLEEFDLEEVEESDLHGVHYICTLASERAAYLTATGIATILHRIGKERVTVAMDGSLYRYHPHFHDLMINKLKDMVPATEVTMMLSEDGSGKGAALVAAVAARLVRSDSGHSLADTPVLTV